MIFSGSTIKISPRKKGMHNKVHNKIKKNTHINSDYPLLVADTANIMIIFKVLFTIVVGKEQNKL